MKNILLFADGTSENSRGGEDGIKTNIGKMLDLAIIDKTQSVYYRYGVGSKNNPIVKYAQRAVGYGLRSNMMDLYEHLIKTYEDGDEIYVFGFSRGAYTVRSLVGLINAFGIIKDADEEDLNAIKDLYRIPPEFRKFYPAYDRIKKLPSKKTRVKFVGTFDSVVSLGIPFPGVVKAIEATGSLSPLTSWNIELLSKICVGYHDTTLRNVDYAYQAVAMDDRRSTFAPALWTEANDPNLKEIKQVWFTGVHSDIGGGYEEDGLSNITLKWMLQKALACGAKFNPVADSSSTLILHDEFSQWYYKISGKTPRVIGEQLACKEYIHETAHNWHMKGLPVHNDVGYKNALELPIEQ